MAMATSETMSQDEPPRTIQEEPKSDDSEKTIPYEANEEDTTLVTDEEMVPQEDWSLSLERQEEEQATLRESSGSRPSWKGRPPT
jgi:NACalpha-BTF3-like transcription factor